MRAPVLPDGWRLDPDVLEHDPARGIWWVITDEGVRTAWNEPTPGVENASKLVCPVCKADPALQADCQHCAGRGGVDSVPYADRPWDEIIDNLWLGGVHCQFGNDEAPGGNAFPADRFDVVVSLFHAPGYEPAPGVEHHQFSIVDGDLDPDHHEHLDYLAGRIQADVENGRKVLVRCQAGLNRSALVVGLVLLRRGWSTSDAVGHMRRARSPYVLFNRHFVQHLQEVETRG